MALAQRTRVRDYGTDTLAWPLGNTSRKRLAFCFGWVGRDEHYCTVYMQHSSEPLLDEHAIVKKFPDLHVKLLWSSWKEKTADVLGRTTDGPVCFAGGENKKIQFMSDTCWYRRQQRGTDDMARVLISSGDFTIQELWDKEFRPQFVWRTSDSSRSWISLTMKWVASNNDSVSMPYKFNELYGMNHLMFFLEASWTCPQASRRVPTGSARRGYIVRSWPLQPTTRKELMLPPHTSTKFCRKANATLAHPATRLHEAFLTLAGNRSMVIFFYNIFFDLAHWLCFPPNYVLISGTCQVSAEINMHTYI
jgi:hypothetical protein